MIQGKEQSKARKNNSPDTGGLQKLFNTELSFSFLQFLKWVLVIFDVIFCLLVATGYWQFADTGARSHAYFVAATYLTIALVQLPFLAIYFIAKFLTRLHKR